MAKLSQEEDKRELLEEESWTKWRNTEAIWPSLVIARQL